MSLTRNPTKPNERSVTEVGIFKQQALKSVYILTTGGTIAGAADSEVSTIYTAAKMSSNELIEGIPALQKYNPLVVEEVVQKDSSDLSMDDLVNLAKRVNEILENDDVQGVVITHGTDTMEETAYFLNLVVKSEKPVVLVGSMRPATSMSPDGDMNLYNALAVIRDAKANGRGVMVVMNDHIYPARDVTKTNTTNVDTFCSPNSGPIGVVTTGVVNFKSRPERCHTVDSKFDIADLANGMPEVEIIPEYLGSNGKQLERTIRDQNPPAGIVIAGTGNGNIVERDRALLEEARKKGIQIVRSSRTGSGYVTRDIVGGLDTSLGLIPADDLNPQKARMLLMLAIARRLKKNNEIADTEKLNKYFGKY